MHKKQEKPKLLYLVHRFPYPPNRGDRIRSYNLLKYLAERFDIYLGTLSDETPTSEQISVLESLCVQVAVFPLGKHWRWLRAAGSLASGSSATEGLFQSRGLAEQIRKWNDELDFDLTLAFCSSMVQFVPEELPLIVDLVDVDSQKWFDYADRASVLKRQLFRLEGRRLRKFECSLPARCRAITLVSEAEADLFREVCPNSKTYSISNGVDLEYYRPGSVEDSLRTSLPNPSCVFVGALDYRANIRGLEWFVQNCWPAIRQQKPEATLDLVGRNPVAAIERMADLPGVRLIGQVPDIRNHVHQANIVVAPLQTARGIQNKVLEAMAMAKPVVATPQAIEGIDCRIGKEILQATSPNEWARTIVDLLNDEPRRKALGDAARSFVEKEFSWSAKLSRMEPLIESVSELAFKTTNQLVRSDQGHANVELSTVRS